MKLGEKGPKVGDHLWLGVVVSAGGALVEEVVVAGEPVFRLKSGKMGWALGDQE